MLDKPHILSLNSFNKFNSSYGSKIILKLHFMCENIKIMPTFLLASFHNFTKICSFTGGLSILIHGVISLPGAWSYDKII